MAEKLNTENIAMELIANSGEARALAFSALHEAKLGHTQEAKVLLKQSEDSSLRAHKAQTSLLVSEANGEKNDINILLIHAQDHLMTSLLAQELIKELIELHEIKADRKG
jgi:PTS system cellobiose-specific IIA component